jgi:kynurenine formamidase
MPPLTDLIQNAKVYDLAQPYFVGMPHHPAHPPFLFGLVKKHGDYTGPGGNSSASDSIALGTHVGTHIDALSHFSCGGRLYGGVEAAAGQSYGGGVQKWAIEGVPPIVRRGILLDIAGQDGGLPYEFEITPGHLDDAVKRQNVEIREGDVVLLRTGWARYFENAPQFIAEVRGPGPAIGGARWLSARGVYAAGSDTVAFEKVPDAAMPVHVHLLVESGIHIIECLNLEEIAAARVYEFLFLALPLKIRGATASPIRPVAVAG